MMSSTMFSYSSVPSRTATHSPMVEDLWSEVINFPPPPTSSLPSRQPAQAVVKTEELTSSPDFRNLRSPVLPRTTSNFTHSQVAIQAHTYKTSTTNRGQDVPPVVISAATYPTSTAPRSDVYSHPFFETTVSTGPPSTHVLTDHIRPRPRTSSQVFTSSHELVAHYGLPQSLPPVPSTIPRRTPTQPDPAPSIHQAVPNFESLRSEYLNMLAQQSTDNTMTADSTHTAPQTVSPADLMAPCNKEQLRGLGLLDAYLHDMSPVSPDIDTPDLTADFYLSSPLFGDSPFDDEFLTTPVIPDDGDSFTDPLDGGQYALFPEMNPRYMMDYEKPQPLVASPRYDELYKISPVSPALHDFNSPTTIDPSSVYSSKRLPSDLPAFPPSTATTPSLPSTPAPSTRRKSSATGTRKGVTPEALVPIDAPTQPRKYIIPSATSRKEVPTVFARKRPRSQAFADDEDELLEELRPDATEREQIEYKRRQNTVAARRSRKRKLEFQQKILDDNERLQRGRDMWRERARMLQGMMEAGGIPCPAFPADEDEQ